MEKIVILGGGAWGQALAYGACISGADVILWNRTLRPLSLALKPFVLGGQGLWAEEGVETRHGPGAQATGFSRDKPGGRLTTTCDLSAALRYPALVMLAVASSALDVMIPAIAHYACHWLPAQNEQKGLSCVLRGGESSPRLERNQGPGGYRSYCPMVILASKGLNPQNPFFFTETLSAALPRWDIGVLGGPNIASEVLAGWPCAMTVASHSSAVFKAVTKVFQGAPWTLESSEDLVGVQLAGVMKNIMAIGYGLMQQCGPSQNMWASFLTIALQQMAHVLEQCGGKSATLLSFALVGDFILTSHSPLGRNSSFGRNFPKKPSNLVEGTANYPAFLEFLRQRSISFPLAQSLEGVFLGNISVEQWAKTALFSV